jgi:hypothetical protein
MREYLTDVWKDAQPQRHTARGDVAAARPEMLPDTGLPGVEWLVVVVVPTPSVEGGPGYDPRDMESLLK